MRAGKVGQNERDANGDFTSNCTKKHLIDTCLSLLYFMGRIVTSVRVQNALDLECQKEFTALVDTGAAYLSLPAAWIDDFGDFQRIREESLVNATGDKVVGKIAGPVAITISGFELVYGDVLFVDMKPDENGNYEPLLGYIPMEQSNVAVDMVAHRLMLAKLVDLK